MDIDSLERMLFQLCEDFKLADDHSRDFLEGLPEEQRSKVVNAINKVCPLPSLQSHRIAFRLNPYFFWNVGR